jgi:hypothetical protein
MTQPKHVGRSNQLRKRGFLQWPVRPFLFQPMLEDVVKVHC